MMQTRNLGGSFLATPPSATFIPEDFGPEERLMIGEAEQFSRKVVLPLAERLDRQEDGLMPGLIRRAGELGFCGIDSPEEYGGLGLPKNLAARMLEFLSLDASFSVTYGITSGISQVGLSLFGTPEQKAAYLPRLTAGEWIGAYALSEPNSGTDALSATTRADRRGDSYVLTGTKMWISNAKWADLFLVMAKVDGERFSSFLVEADRPGITIGREEHKMGLKGSSTARLILDQVEIPVANLLHAEGLGHQVAFNALNLGRFKLASMSLGPAREALRLATEYAQDRRQFGQPIASFGLVRKKLAQMATLFFAAESAIYRTGALIDEAFASSDGTPEGNRAAAEEFAIECSAIKVFATEVEAFIVDEALQIFGGYGFTEEFPVARLYRDARVSRIYEGTNEINRVALATTLYRRAKAGRISILGSSETFISGLAAQALVAQPSLPEDQVRLGAISDLLILQYVEQSTASRARRLGGVANHLAAIFGAWANPRAAEAYQVVTGQSVTLPPIGPLPIDEVAEAVIHKGGVL
ncbi:MAG: acyl-CoA dehydrogenase family protein [Fimbriimonas sp.]